jgi:four helix bundle protein
MKDLKENIIVKMTFEFALKIISFSEILEEKRKFIIARQLLRAGTSIGANINVAQNAESKADFIHKLKIAAKEADETLYWLTLCEMSDNYPADIELKERLLHIINILSKIIISSKSQNLL